MLHLSFKDKLPTPFELFVDEASADGRSIFRRLDAASVCCVRHDRPQEGPEIRDGLTRYIGAAEIELYLQRQGIS